MSDSLALKYLMLFKHDSQNLIERIRERRHEFIDEFSLKRDRSIFDEIFFNRYKDVKMSELALCSEEVIGSLNQFYKVVDDLFWYLKHTQDMPNTIEDEVIVWVKKLEKSYEMLELYINAEEEILSPPEEQDIQMDEVSQNSGYDEGEVSSDDQFNFDHSWDQDYSFDDGPKDDIHDSNFEYSDKQDQEETLEPPEFDLPSLPKSED